MTQGSWTHCQLDAQGYAPLLLLMSVCLYLSWACFLSEADVFAQVEVACLAHAGVRHWSSLQESALFLNELHWQMQRDVVLRGGGGGR